MRIPNKFNGYSRDGIRLYNDPTTVVATIANMGSGAAAAATIAEAAAAAAAAEAATTAATAATTAPATAAAEQAAAQAAAQQAGQAGIMQGAAVPPPGITPPGAPGLGAPMPPATPPVPAGSTAATTAGAAPTLPKYAFPDFTNPAFTGNPTAPVDLALAPPPGPAPAQIDPFSKGPFGDSGINVANSGVNAADTTVQVADTANKFSLSDSAIGRGMKTAMDYVGKNPLTSLGGVMTAQKIGLFGGNDGGEPKDEYKRTPYAGLSPSFASTESGEYRQPGGPSKYLYGFADGGITGPVEQMSNMNAIGGNTMYPMANIPRLEYANPVQQRPVSENIMTMGGDSPTDPYTGQLKFNEGGYAEDKKKREAAEQRKHYSQLMEGRSGSDLENDIAQGQAIAAKARGSSAGIIPFDRETQLGTPTVAAKNKLTSMFKGKGIKSYLPKTLDPQSGSAGAGETEYAAAGGVMYGLGGYSDGGRLLKGPGDGVSDSIPATIGNRQPARLADGEFVIPARIVSELGNGSTEAGARQLYAMMERIQKGRKKSVGKGKVAVNSKAAKHLPA
jgi:hypothetical protein